MSSFCAFLQMRDGAPAAARVEGRDEGAARHHHARRRQGQDLRRKAEGVLATPAQVKPELEISKLPPFPIQTVLHTTFIMSYYFRDRASRTLTYNDEQFHILEKIKMQETIRVLVDLLQKECAPVVAQGRSIDGTTSLLLHCCRLEILVLVLSSKWGTIKDLSFFFLQNP